MNQQSGGVFDKNMGQKNMRPENKETTVTQIQKKEDFKSPQELAESSRLNKRPMTKEVFAQDDSEKAAEQINNAISGASSNVEKELKEMENISEEDLKLAEALIFNGYSEFTKQVPNMKNHTITVCSTSPEEIDLVEEMIFDLCKQNENKEDKSIDLPDSTVRSARNMYSLALGYKGLDGKDMCLDRTMQVELIKKAIGKISEYEISGDIKELGEAKKVIKEAIKKRSMLIKKIPTPIVDMISTTKYEFDQKMFAVMSTNNILPKY